MVFFLFTAGLIKMYYSDELIINQLSKKSLHERTNQNKYACNEIAATNLNLKALETI